MEVCIVLASYSASMFPQCFDTLACRKARVAVFLPNLLNSPFHNMHSIPEVIWTLPRGTVLYVRTQQFKSVGLEIKRTSPC